MAIVLPVPVIVIVDFYLWRETQCNFVSVSAHKDHGQTTRSIPFCLELRAAVKYKGYEMPRSLFFIFKFQPQCKSLRLAKDDSAFGCRNPTKSIQNHVWESSECPPHCSIVLSYVLCEHFCQQARNNKAPKRKRKDRGAFPAFEFPAFHCVSGW